MRDQSPRGTKTRDGRRRGTMSLIFAILDIRSSVIVIYLRLKQQWMFATEAKITGNNRFISILTDVGIFGRKALELDYHNTLYIPFYGYLNIAFLLHFCTLCLFMNLFIYYALFLFYFYMQYAFSFV